MNNRHHAFMERVELRVEDGTYALSGGKSPKRNTYARVSPQTPTSSTFHHKLHLSVVVAK
jgi:hypothetical protein